MNDSVPSETRNTARFLPSDWSRSGYPMLLVRQAQKSRRKPHLIVRNYSVTLAFSTLEALGRIIQLQRDMFKRMVPTFCDRPILGYNVQVNGCWLKLNVLVLVL